MTTGDAQSLAALIREATSADIARDALHLGLGALPPHLRQPHHDRLVEEALAPALSPSRGRLFTLPNGDLVAIAPPGGRHLPAARDALAALFGGIDASPPLALLRLPEAAARLLAAIEASISPATGPAAVADPGTARFPSAELAAVERSLAHASLDAFLRRSPVCRLARDGGEATRLWSEWALDAPALRAALLPGSDPAAAPALADRLARLLDRRLLAELARPQDATKLGTAGLTLRLTSPGEAAFQRLDAVLGPAARAALTLWFAASEILALPAEWALVRAFAASRGYRLGLDAPGPGTAALLPPDRVGAAMLRFRWRPDLPAAATAVPAVWPIERVVLTGVDRTAAIGWGWEAGITHFEGRLLNPPG